MGGTRASSLHLRLWAVIALAVVPMFLMVVFDYRAQRQKAIVTIERDVARMLVAARQEEELGLQRVQVVLQIMANSDNMRALDQFECSNLARRLLSSLTDFHNIGAVLPNGTLFCSGIAPGAGCFAGCSRLRIRIAGWNYGRGKCLRIVCPLRRRRDRGCRPDLFRGMTGYSVCCDSC